MGPNIGLSPLVSATVEVLPADGSVAPDVPDSARPISAFSTTPAGGIRFSSAKYNVSVEQRCAAAIFSSNRFFCRTALHCSLAVQLYSRSFLRNSLPEYICTT